jgi:hypothetical protein
MLGLQDLHGAHILFRLPAVAAISVQTANKPPIKSPLCNEIYLNIAVRGRASHAEALTGWRLS